MSNKLSKGVHSLGYLLQNPSSLKLIQQSNELWKKAFKKSFPDKERFPIIDISTFLQAGIKEVNPNYGLGDGSSIMDYLLLNNLAKSIPNCKYFEIGIWRGESILNVSKYASKCVCLDLPDSHYNSDETLNELVALRNKRLESQSNIKRLEGDSNTFNFTSLGQKFDLIFIDGSHAYEHLLSDTKNIFQHLIHEESVVVWHDYGYTPESIRYEVFKGIMDGVPKNLQKYLYHVSHTKCAIWTNRKMSLSNKNSTPFPWPGTSNYSLQMDIK